MDSLVTLITTVSTSILCHMVAILYWHTPRCWHSSRQKIVWKGRLSKNLPRGFFVAIWQETPYSITEIAKTRTRHTYVLRWFFLILIYWTMTKSRPNMIKVQWTRMEKIWRKTHEVWCVSAISLMNELLRSFCRNRNTRVITGVKNHETCILLVGPT